jgi:hypothetical protein
MALQPPAVSLVPWVKVVQVAQQTHLVLQYPAAVAVAVDTSVVAVVEPILIQPASTVVVGVVAQVTSTQPSSIQQPTIQRLNLETEWQALHTT